MTPHKYVLIIISLFLGTGLASAASEGPQNAALPAVSGTAQVGELLTALPGTWSGAPTLNFEWRRCDPAVSNCQPIQGATAPTYEAQTADQGLRLRVLVTARDDTDSTTQRSNPTAIVASGTDGPVNKTSPAVLGAAQIGQMLSVSAGTWSGAPSFTYEWRRCDVAVSNCQPIAGASSETYGLQVADRGARFRVLVTARNTAGYAISLSPTTQEVTETLPAPTNTDPPTVSGVAQVGKMLRASPGGWSGAPTLTYQWQRCDSAVSNCRPVPGATAANYPLSNADAGSKLRARITASNGGGSTTAVSPTTATVAAATVAAAEVVDLAKLCPASNCDAALARLEAGTSYHLPAGVWRFTKPFNVPSGVTLTGDGVGITGTDLVYSGPKISGAVITAGAYGSDWTNGHISGLEIETDQLHRLRPDDVRFASMKVDQAGVGLEVINPTSTSTVNDIAIWKFGQNSILIDNHATSPGSGFFQLSDFFIGTSPIPLKVRGSSARLLVRFGGIDLGPLSQLGMLFAGERRGATSVVEAVKIEGDYDVPGYVVEGGAPVVFVGTTRYLNQSLYVDDPINGAPAFTHRNSLGSGTNVLQCLACTALGEKTALALPDLSLSVPTSKWGINLHRLTVDGANAVAEAAAVPETRFVRPQKVVNLGPLCPAHDCDQALANLKHSGRYRLPAGSWEFSRPFTIPYGVTLFGDGSQQPNAGGSELRYVGSLLAGDAAVRFGAGGGDAAGRLFSLRITTTQRLAGGFGIRARDATNAGTIEDVSVAGFRDGQLLIDATSNSTSGPNFFRVSRFSLSGGVHPLKVEGGRQTLLIEHGTINLDASSQEGIYLEDGEQLAATRTIASVSVSGAADVPGFRVRGPAVTAFLNDTRSTGAPAASPGFSYEAAVPRAVVECLRCSVNGPKRALSMPGLGVVLSSPAQGSFDYLVADSALVSSRAPFNVHLPSVTGPPAVGTMLSATTGDWARTPAAYTYQWIRCKRPDVPSNPANRCAPIAGATGSTYSVVPADLLTYLRVKVVAKNPMGAEFATSLPVDVST